MLWYRVRSEYVFLTETLMLSFTSRRRLGRCCDRKGLPTLSLCAGIGGLVGWLISWVVLSLDVEVKHDTAIALSPGDFLALVWV